MIALRVGRAFLALRVVTRNGTARTGLVDFKQVYGFQFPIVGHKRKQ